MVKEYKCILEYPDCKKGTIVRYQKEYYPEYFDIKSGKRYDISVIENYPKYWEELNKPLFVTEDGISIYDKDPLYLIKKYKTIHKAYIVNIKSWNRNFGNKGKPIYSDLAFFHLENAEKWLEDNKDNRYEIIALQAINYPNKISTHYKDGKVMWNSDDRPEYKYVNELLEEGSHTIYSIRRTSDGEVFSLGDKIYCDWNRGEYSITEIYYNEHDQLSYRTDAPKAPRVHVFNDGTEKYVKPKKYTLDEVYEQFKNFVNETN